MKIHEKNLSGPDFFISTLTHRYWLSISSASSKQPKFKKKQLWHNYQCKNDRGADHRIADTLLRFLQNTSAGKSPRRVLALHTFQLHASRCPHKGPTSLFSLLVCSIPERAWRGFIFWLDSTSFWKLKFPESTEKRQKLCIFPRRRSLRQAILTDFFNLGIALCLGRPALFRFSSSRLPSREYQRLSLDVNSKLRWCLPVGLFWCLLHVQ